MKGGMASGRKSRSEDRAKEAVVGDRGVKNGRCKRKN